MQELIKRLKQETIALYLATRDPRTPLGAKILVGIIVAYALSPIDLIPDFIPVLGYLDDMILLPIGIWFALKLIPQEVMAESREKAKAISAAPMSWAGAIGIGALWLGALALCGSWLYLTFT